MTTSLYHRAAIWLAALSLIAACSPQAAIPAGPPAVSEKAAGLITQESPAENAALQTLYRQALQNNEKEAVAYIGSVPEELQPLMDAFTARFPGLQLNLQRMMGDKLHARIDAEFNSGRHAADMVFGGLTDMRTLLRNGRLAAYVPPTLGALDRQFYGPGDFYHAPFKKGFSIAYNPTLIKKEELPATIADLVNPKWKGRFAYPSLAIFGPGDLVLALSQKNGALTDAQLQWIEANGLHGPPTSELIPSVAQGRLLFTVWSGSAAIVGQQLQGANLGIAFLPKLGVHLNTGIGLLQGAPHLNAARLAKAWLFTPQAQAILADLNFYGTMPDAPAPRGFPPLNTYLNKDLPEDDQLIRLLETFHTHKAAVMVKGA
jgi:iron(III) transport system substrate-binding protein